MTGLVLTSVLGKVFFANGRSGYSEFGVVTLDEALASFDRYATWVAAGNGGPDDDGSPEMRALVVKAHAEAQRIASDGPKGIEQVIANYYATRAAWIAADPDGECDGLEWDAYDGAETAVLQFPCETMQEVRAKALLCLTEEGALDSLKNCFFGDDVRDDVLTRFLKSLLGEHPPVSP